MLHDLYLLSVYFEPTQAVQYEDDLFRRYGSEAVNEALGQGWIERLCAPCAKGDARFFCRLSPAGEARVQGTAA